MELSMVGSTLEQMRAVVAQEFGVSIESIDVEHNIVAEFALDSLEALSLLKAIYTAFSVDIPLSAFPHLYSVRLLSEHVDRELDRIARTAE
jgi:acyl carrier protein